MRTAQNSDMCWNLGRIRYCLDELRKTHQEVADAIGVKRANFTAFLTGKRPLPHAASRGLLDFIALEYEAKIAADAVRDAYGWRNANRANN